MSKKKTKKAKAARSAKAKSAKKVKRAKVRKQKKQVKVAATTFAKRAKQMTPMVVMTKANGIGHVFTNEPKVKVILSGKKTIEKTVVHLMKQRSPKDETLVPKISGGKPMKMLCVEGSFEMIKAPMPIRVRGSRATGISNRDYSKYEFGGQVLNKGRLCLAIIRKFVEEKNPTLPEIKSVFSDEAIKPYGHLFLLADEARTANGTSARSRFFSKDEDLITINGGNIAVTNQIDAAVTQRMLSVAIGVLNYEIKPCIKQS